MAASLRGTTGLAVLAVSTASVGRGVGGSPSTWPPIVLPARRAEQGNDAERGTV